MLWPLIAGPKSDTVNGDRVRFHRRSFSWEWKALRASVLGRYTQRALAPAFSFDSNLANARSTAFGRSPAGDDGSARWFPPPLPLTSGPARELRRVEFGHDPAAGEIAQLEQFAVDE